MATLRHELGLAETVVYGVGLILGAGIYAILDEAAGVTGQSVVVSFLVTVVVASAWPRPSSSSSDPSSMSPRRPVPPSGPSRGRWCWPSS